MALDIGIRVRVAIIDREQWAVGAADSLNGLTGTIVDYKADYGFIEPEGCYLVELDREPKKWSTHQTPGRGWWFSPRDLQPL